MISRRDFVRICTMAGAAVGMSATTVSQIVELPASATGVIPLTLATENGFSPSQADPSSKDRRFLGIWVEVVNE